MNNATTMNGLRGLAGRMTEKLTGKSGGEHTAMIMQKVRKLADKEPGKAPLIGHFPVEKQYLYSGGALIVSLLLAAGFTIYSLVQLDNRAGYEARSGELKVLSQRLPLTAQQSVLGNADAFKKLAEGKVSFEQTLTSLAEGDGDVPATRGAASDSLEKINGQWKKIDPQVKQILSQQKNLVALNENVKRINALSIDLQEVAEQLASQLADSGGSVREVSRANHLVMLSQRLPKNANLLLSADLIDPEVVLQLEKDTTSFRDTVQSLMGGAASRNEDSLMTLEDLGGNMGDMVEAVGEVLANTQPLLQSKVAANNLFAGSDALLADTERLSQDYQSVGGLSYLLAASFGVLALASLVMLGLVNINETKSRARKSEEENSRNQEAILRLMDELGELAEGNLTINASVTEDITGAVADSINYTVEELRSLVRGINNATVQMDQAASEAGQVSDTLQQAARRQTEEIEETSAAVVNLAQSVQQVSGNAAESARVAEQSLAAAEKGQQAVANAIASMNTLREQIQETSKRIKRLGESSQEIGEIVELISDITEQTNVLALNAAIQAASAGEAGRGFSVVAEEVQRLAERSADATKQIAAIVKTIQSDTHDTVAAMEISTQGVVEGAKLSDAAGQTLAEIGDVSKTLAELIADISSATQSQAESTAKVAETMQDIKAISAQTSSGTQQTAESIGGMKQLAQDLKNSVAGFKLA
ncbi:MAG: type IV pili methyl-accepting chemotaxis transducer N-terminal domain-containing protein [Gammaproteobacteria bacterium]|nr:type IV pili methyl-accepting chemotaxis transducer N-terminal domain-containing protein [Gammaproteobacteria bacterium]MBU1408607.1 type IV pili methyl-accepting chemotaxis transducer N-terminal domain-containing protein [Gammaproteobacteria bacterium]MBU1532419.1 type IV pili methyl-accepting chemotaxis transducer N-terminal domain-containing protein [Gammaproteobacteria bacterium]